MKYAIKPIRFFDFVENYNLCFHMNIIFNVIKNENNLNKDEYEWDRGKIYIENIDITYQDVLWEHYAHWKPLNEYDLNLHHFLLQKIYNGEYDYILEHYAKCTFKAEFTDRFVEVKNNSSLFYQTKGLM